jgi:putative transposase
MFGKKGGEEASDLATGIEGSEYRLRESRDKNPRSGGSEKWLAVALVLRSFDLAKFNGMSQALSGVYLHLVFSTKDRRRYFQDLHMRERMFEYLGGISKGLGCEPVRIGGVDDHVHLLCRFGRTLSQAEWVKELKRGSALWLKAQGASFRDFSWQGGYATFSVSASNLERVAEYVAKQEEHHRKLSFQDELRTMLRKHGVGWDERYLWD